jgi:hypothetical protein
MAKHADDEEVILTYSASSNITFHGELPTGVTWGEWREMTMTEQNDVVNDAIGELLDIGVKDDE